ncbi:anti-sigma factor family protein [Paenibacillus zanthoxyli]|uniref:anti-sigma factor family protein n=1 Tax=Paenibacillus zanthoxyli TaxID=369399 RepID=UPI00047211DE|nr:zf-HC2 domain-containing protein [Paenibacillus zanthoxyli]
MKCNVVMEWLPHYIEGLLAPEAEREMTQHIAACQDCARWLEEAKAMEEIWKETAGAPDFQPLSDIPDLVPQVMAEIERLESARQSDGAGPAASRRRSVRRTSWVHYGLAACLTFVLLQYGVFEQLGYGLTQINGQMSNSVMALFGPQQPR